MNLLANLSASRFAVRGAHWTDAQSPLCFNGADISTRAAVAGYLDVINAFSADPLPRLSVEVGDTWTLVLGSG